jgi:hypothetical protein
MKKKYTRHFSIEKFEKGFDMIAILKSQESSLYRTEDRQASQSSGFCCSSRIPYKMKMLSI